MATVIEGGCSAFALLHRAQRGPASEVEVLLGDVLTVDRLADLPLPQLSGQRPAEPVADLLVLLPYRQIAERGFAARQDGTPMSALRIERQQTLPTAEALERLPDVPVELGETGFDVVDDDYAEIVRRVIEDEIGRGEGANFVIRRSFVTTVTNHSAATALSIFRQLLRCEPDAYWIFVVHLGDRTLVGATPERHVSLSDGTLVMNPISGTYRYPADGPTLPGLLDFLADRKEIDELNMVVDEELKMMGRLCPGGGRVVGPFLREMSRLAHTEYLLVGQSDRDVPDILRESMFAPTVTGSPLENACTVITRHEPHGRGYYAGVVALVGRYGDKRTLDSAILIRTAELDRAGRLSIGVGATLVRHSDPAAEVAETRAKANGLVAAIHSAGRSGTDAPADRVDAGRLREEPRVREALEARRALLAPFWLRPAAQGWPAVPHLLGRRVLVIDAEDTFTAMLGHQLGALGLTVDIQRYDLPVSTPGYDFVLLGPGPGDPRETTHPKIARLRELAERLLAQRTPVLAVCLGHQVLTQVLGLPLRRRGRPAQGEQRVIDLFGRPERVGFYNTFTAVSESPKALCLLPGDPPLECVVEISRDAETGEVHAVRGPGLASVQFHLESVLTENGPEILAEMVCGLLGVPAGLPTPQQVASTGTER